MKTKIRTTAAAHRAAGYLGKLLPIAAAAFALHATSAGAVTLDWSYTGPGINNGGGAFDATLQNDGSYLLDGITGTVNGQNIIGLDNFDGSDNLVFPPSPPNIGVDRNGIAFIGFDGTEYNLYEDDGGYTPGSEFYCGAVYCLISSASDVNTDDVQIDAAVNNGPVALTSFSVTLAAVPEPATWAMMVLGLGGIGATLRSRRRPVAATA